jgi:hypothetical protein
MTVWNGDAFAKLTFTGVTGSVTASNQSVGPIDMGTLHVRTGGTGTFMWPGMIAPTIGSFFVSVLVETINAPNSSSGGIGLKFLRTSPTSMQGYLGEGRSNHVLLGLPYQQPSFLNYKEVVFGTFNLPVLSEGDADYQIYAEAVSIIPEPATYALMALGLAAVGVAARRRKV